MPINETTVSNGALVIIGVVAALVILAISYKLILRLFGVVIIPENCIGIVNKKFVLFGENKTLPDGEIIALKGEAGLQAETLPPGIHFLYWPWQYEIDKQMFITIDQGLIGVVEARGGFALTDGRVLGKHVSCDSFQDVRKFLEGGGQRGPQIAVIPPGTYRINTGFFSVIAENALSIPDNKVGVVTTKDGTPLPTGDIAGREIAGHNSYQDGEKFLAAGGFRGLQEQVLLAGLYYINPRFATVEIVDMTTVPIAHAGVVIAYVGDVGVDVTGVSFKHGNLVSRGQKGVWVDPLDPGKYPINPYTHKVENVPTANVVLNWATGKTESHKLDEKLCTIKVRSQDGFTFNLDVSQIIHIPRSDAPKVIARFGNVANLVTQVLEPTIGNYFRNAAQGADVIEFLKGRQQRQASARERISEALVDYNVVAVDTLIGDIVPPEELMKTLTDRKIAEQERVTYATQMEAQTTRQALEQATALADTQKRVVDAERSVTIAEFGARAAVKNAEGQAGAKKVQAEADAMVVVTVGNAEAGRTLAIGNAEAEVTKAKIASMEAGNYAVIQVADALAKSGVKLVPDILVSGSQGGAGGTLVDVLLGGLIKDQLAKTASPKPVPAGK
jgi:uncharacterized membrane protein YqiK